MNCQLVRSTSPLMPLSATASTRGSCWAARRGRAGAGAGVSPARHDEGSDACGEESDHELSPYVRASPSDLVGSGPFSRPGIQGQVRAFPDGPGFSRGAQLRCYENALNTGLKEVHQR
jgi:hypothetical protein